jgi:hypothetical protein
VPKQCQSGLTRTEKGFCRTVGYYLSNDRRRVPRKFWLGRDRAAAFRKMKVLTEAWDDLPGERGEKVWTDEAVQAALGSVEGAGAAATSALPAPMAPTAVPVFLPQPVPPPQPSRTFTLLTALDEYCASFRERTDIGDYHRDGTVSRVKSIKQHLEDISVEQQGAGKVWLKDVPMSAVDMEWLGRVRNKITARPLTRHRYDTPRPISIDCVKNWLMALGMAFDWFDLTPRIGWVAPHPRWRENFGLTKKQEYAIRTPQERDGKRKPKPPFTVDELAKIYRNSSKLGRKYLLMGLFLGWSQEAISSFLTRTFVQVGGEYFVDRSRGKTGVEGFWWVCPELAEALKESMAKTPPNSDGLAFLTEDGLPLVHGKTDTIRLTWERCLNMAPEGVRNLPFGRVKKCGAQIIKNLGGQEMAQLFLAHASATVADVHYVGDDVEVGVGKTPFERLHDVQRQMYDALKSQFFVPARLPRRP